MAPQDRITFQPDKGFREIMDKAIAEKTYGPKRTLAFIINEALREKFGRDGLLPKPRK